MDDDDLFFDGIFFDGLGLELDEEEVPRQPRRYRPRFNFDVLSEREVVDGFRLTRETILRLRDRITEYLSSAYLDRATDLTPLQQLLIAIR